jgi:hypothetical protein
VLQLAIGSDGYQMVFERGNPMTILWIILVVVVVLALLGFLGFR